ncbi:MAG: sulfatase-like hydrolase/transferase [Cellvibrio sp.]|uniref:sulfatase-like hydrolase/transferase n=1 Tax=Cellvibrio sp. TaxID=1965322 RepID=UPI00319FD9A5
MTTHLSPRRYFRSFLNIAALVFIFVALVIPNQLTAFSLPAFLFFPLELPLLGLLLLVPGRTGLILRWIMAALLALGIIFKCADMATYKVFARPFNPVFDIYLFANGMNLLNGAIGKAGAFLVALLLIFLVLVIIAAAFWVLGRAQTLLRASVRVSAGVLVGGLVLWLLLFLIGWPKASAQFYHHVKTHLQHMLDTVADIKSFRLELEEDDAVARADKNLFAQLQGKDVLVVFVESYGRTALDNPEFAPHVRPLLERTTNLLSEKGFVARSGFLTSPTVGGLSWLAHGTAMSGLWIDNQIRYDNLMMSDRPTLNRIFKQAGWRTVAVMPAITMAWPEGQYYGYDQIYDAHNLGYKGKPFNWITMPDQYTLAAFQQRELDNQARTPVMAEIALISSHAPWTPVPHVIDWNSVGDGTVFNAQALSGDSPEEVWKDNARIRLQFRLSIEYALENIASYVLNYGNDNLVVLVFGDHQPAPLVTGDTVNRDVPIHLIARDPKVIDAVDHWHWTSGMLPADDAPVWRMDELRNKFIDAFSLPEN